jgi:hypothetical protein
MSGCALFSATIKDSGRCWICSVASGDGTEGSLKFCRGLRSRGAPVGLHEWRPEKLCRVLGRHPNPSNLQFTGKIAESCHTTRHSPAG